MEQHMQYLMWLKSKQIFKSQFRPSIDSINNSWEEQAFAEDAAGPLGGFIWPPRSYSCTFCRREFRSAQALGGHMNVHRRDRARLKQSSLSPQPELQIETRPPFPAGESPHAGDSPSPYSSTSSVVLSPQNSTTIPSKHPYSPQGSDSSNSGKFLSLSNQKMGNELLYSNKGIVIPDNEDTVDTSLSIGLSLKRGYDYEEERHNLSRKRQRVNNDVTLLSSTNTYVLHTEVVTRNEVDENIDLELRLGDSLAMK